MSTLRVTDNMVSNEALRDAFLRLRRDEGLTTCILAERLGWYRTEDRGDTNRIARMLGLVDGRTRGQTYRQEYIRWENVGPICRAMGLIPAELGY